MTVHSTAFEAEQPASAALVERFRLMNTAMSPDYAGDQLFIPNVVRGAAGDAH